MTATVETGSPQSPEHETESAGATLSGAFNDYLTKVRGGDVGALPAVLGFAVLVILFSVLQPGTFATLLNWANLLNQAAGVIFIAMGLVFVLLLGEIDLSAGYTAGVSASVIAVLMTEHNIAWPIAMIAALLVGLVIGTIIGLLVAELGIPSFVVTLAAFLALQGVLLFVIGTGGTIAVRNSVILALMNNNVTPVLGWVMWLVVVGGYAGLSLLGVARRRSAGLPAASPVLMIARVAAWWCCC